MTKLKKVKEKLNIKKEKIKKRIRKAKEKIMLIKPIRRVDWITLSNAMFGLLSIFASINSYFKEACYFIILAALMDYLDGKVARKLNRADALGRELDSLSDIISFGVAPAVLGVVYTGEMVMVIPAIIFVACGIIRLAKFNVQLVEGYYFGMPITVNFIIFSALYFLSAQSYVWFIAYILSAALMITPFKIKKAI